MTDQRGGAAAAASSSSSGSTSASSGGAGQAARPPSSATPPPPPSQASASTDPSTPSKPEVPWAFIDCPTDTLVILIAHMLDLLCQHNDQVVLTPDALTRFHSRASPGISVVEYLRRIVKYTNLEKIPLLSLLAYIDLTCQNLPTFTLSSLTVHRFLIAGVTAGSKAQCDVFCTNSHYAKVGGIKVGELNALEREFLRVTGWALCCNADLLQRYYSSLIRSHGGYTQAPEPEVSPFLPFPNSVDKLAEAAESAPDTPVEDGALIEQDEPAEEEEHSAGLDADGGEAVTDDVNHAVPGGIGGGNPGHGTNVMVLDSPSQPAAQQPAESMEVDSPTVRPSSSSGPPPPAATGPAPDGVHSPEAQHADHHHRGTLKSFVGGIFRRREDSSSGSASASGHSSDKQAAHSDIRGRPLSTAPDPQRLSVPAPTGQPKPVTPRVRTRDERSVESLRTRVGAAALTSPRISVDDGKRRTRVE
ncbi:Nuc-1 negative regulatory protein preg [Vanrija pseudolonga]|uniref:Nuc-1 negative regulatory protein preg n=1 Tax=Vanrija pseudolonga TaxID=143232 RepID=A0AAF0YAT5_9TREE|nr:Nuc-1 negative regulatory protein preg [Vanrija pseudolonga]